MELYTSKLNADAEQGRRKNWKMLQCLCEIFLSEVLKVKLTCYIKSPDADAADGA